MNIQFIVDTLQSLAIMCLAVVALMLNKQKRHWH
jgi:hypothetical protein